MTVWKMARVFWASRWSGEGRDSDGNLWDRHGKTEERVFTIKVINVNDRPEADHQLDVIVEDGTNLFGPSEAGRAIEARFSFTDYDRTWIRIIRQHRS